MPVSGVRPRSAKDASVSVETAETAELDNKQECEIHPLRERLSTDEAFEHAQHGREVLDRHVKQLGRRLVEDRIGACRGGAAGRG